MQVVNEQKDNTILYQLYANRMLEEDNSQLLITTIKCDIEEICEYDEYDKRLIRPDHTEPCHEEFLINEQEIFVAPKEDYYRYYQLCPNCGYMVNIPNLALSSEMKSRVEKRVLLDENLFRKMYLYSELWSLEHNANPQHRRLIKSNNVLK